MRCASLFVCTLLILTVFAAPQRAAADGPQELKTVPYVDLTRYGGTWYEIASIPFFFTKGCHASSASYTLREDGELEIVNRCRKDSLTGKISEVKGKAWVIDKSSNAKLKVQFFWPFTGDYWVLELGENYEYVVVGSPKRNRLWILNRRRQMDETLYAQVSERMAAQGFNMADVRRTAQPRLGDSD